MKQMIKLDERPNTFNKDWHKALIEEILARWQVGRPVDSEDKKQSSKTKFRKEKEGEEEKPYVH